MSIICRIYIMSIEDTKRKYREVLEEINVFKKERRGPEYVALVANNKIENLIFKSVRDGLIPNILIDIKGDKVTYGDDNFTDSAIEYMQKAISIRRWGNIMRLPRDYGYSY